ncbi:MAG: N-acetylmuramoyl-L-alanine amidase [Acidobacteria bacterium]|nr:N-acetylmuramoyl-L-alanine amidase [Acidobacteriota bacterium]
MMVSSPLISRKTVVLFCFSLILTLSCTALAQEKNIKTLWEEAEKNYSNFIKDTRKHKYAEEWEKCVNKYREIVIIKENSIYADDASYMVGYIYFRMYERFSNLSYLNSALSSFNYLLSRHTDSLYREKALYYTGFIYYKYQNDIKQASVYFNELINDYPDSTYTQKAKDISDLMARAAVPTPIKKNGEKVNLTDLKYWSSPDYTRVAVYLDGATSFTNKRIHNPDRIYFDLDNTRISKQIAEWMMVIENNFLRRVRIGHFNTKTTRVVLDLEKVDRYTVFTLNDPFRIIIDVTREEKLVKAGSGNITRPVPDNSNPPIIKPADQKTTGQPDIISPPPDDTGKPDTKPVTLSHEKSVAVIPLKNSSGNYSIVRQLGLGVTTIVIDPGHGGKDPGMVVRKGLYEKDLVLDVAKKLKSILENKKKYQVFLTREKDVYLSLEERTAMAMQYKADLFISLHMNSYRKNTLAGLEIYYLGFAADRQTEALAAYENSMNQKGMGELQDILRMLVDAKIDESKDFASIIGKSINGILKRNYNSFKYRGVKQAPFIVLIGANMPSVLVELGYLSNPDEANRLSTTKYREQMADGLARGIEAYIQNLNGMVVQK